jgi:hypothetical protein
MRRILGRAAGFLMVSSSLFAHHGTNASYDMDKTVTVKGTVTEFVWTNPHCQLFFDGKDEKGNVVRWGAEMNSPGVLKETGWTRSTLKPGDQLTITLHPSKAGTAIGVIQTIALPDGKVLARGAGEPR